MCLITHFIHAFDNFSFHLTRRETTIHLEGRIVGLLLIFETTPTRRSQDYKFTAIVIFQPLHTFYAYTSTFNSLEEIRVLLEKRMINTYIHMYGRTFTHYTYIEPLGFDIHFQTHLCFCHL